MCDGGGGCPPSERANERTQDVPPPSERANERTKERTKRRESPWQQLLHPLLHSLTRSLTHPTVYTTTTPSPANSILGHPDAMFISEMGLRKLLDVGLGLNASDKCHLPFLLSIRVKDTFCLNGQGSNRTLQPWLCAKST